MSCTSSSEDQHLIDLTGEQLKDLNDVSLPPSLVELDLTTNRLSSLDSRLSSLEKLKKVSFRQNLLTDSGVAEFCSSASLFSLEELVFRDNQLNSIPNVENFKKLIIFDVSYNNIGCMHGASKLTSTLKELYLSNNLIEKIEQIEHLTGLTLLELGSNKIRVMEGLAELVNLRELWLGRNKIKEIKCQNFPNLAKISIQSNRLTSMLGFENCVLLEELYLSHNGISKMEGLDTLTNLRVLDVSSNRISQIENLDKLTKLEDLWLNDNKIPNLTNFNIIMSGPQNSLITIYLQRNPCASEPNYLQTIRFALPNIQQVDAYIL